MEDHDEHFEKYLGEFQPRPPRALPERIASKTTRARRLAAVTAMAIGLVLALWSVWQRPAGQGAAKGTRDLPVSPEKQTPRRALSIVALTRLAVENPSGLDAALKAAQEYRLPRFDRKDSALRILAKE